MAHCISRPGSRNVEIIYCPCLFTLVRGIKNNCVASKNIILKALYEMMCFDCFINYLFSPSMNYGGDSFILKGRCAIWKFFVPIQNAPQWDQHPANCGIVTQDIHVDLMLEKLAAWFSGVKGPYWGCLLNLERKISLGPYFLVNRIRCCLIEIK